MTYNNGSFVVICPAGSLPTYEHRNYDTALAEAKRLALKHPDKNFHVLEIKAGVRAETKIVLHVEEAPDETPF